MTALETGLNAQARELTESEINDVAGGWWSIIAAVVGACVLAIDAILITDAAIRTHWGSGGGDDHHRD